MVIYTLKTAWKRIEIKAQNYLYFYPIVEIIYHMRLTSFNQYVYCVIKKKKKKCNRHGMNYSYFKKVGCKVLQ